MSAAAAITEQISFVFFVIIYTFSAIFSPNKPVGLNIRTTTKSTNVNTSLNSEYPAAFINVSESPIINPPTKAPGMLPMPPNTAAITHLRPGSDPESGNTDGRGVK